MPVSTEGRVKQQKLNQTARLGVVWLSFWCSTRFTRRKLYHSGGSYLYSCSPHQPWDTWGVRNILSGEKNGPAAAGEKSERPEKNRGAKRACEIGQTVLSLGREAQRTKRPRRSRGRRGLEAPRKKQAV